MLFHFYARTDEDWRGQNHEVVATCQSRSNKRILNDNENGISSASSTEREKECVISEKTNADEMDNL
jgi:hypothetical protein